MSEQRAPYVGWRFWSQRVLASAVIWAVCWVVGAGGGGYLFWVVGVPSEGAVVGALLGLLVGWGVAVAIQYQFLREQVPWSGRWVLLIFVGGFIGFCGAWEVGSTVGLVVGQALVQTLGASPDVFVITLPFFGFAVSGAVGGAITAGVLLLWPPRLKVEPSKAEDQLSPAVTKAQE